MTINKKTFRRYEPDQTYLFPPDIREWLPEDHLAYFISDTIDELDLSRIYERYCPAPGYPPYDPKMMTKLLTYAYCIGMRSSRQIARATKENIGFRVLAADNYPDFRTICRFRVDHSDAFRSLFRQVLHLCVVKGIARLKIAALDGTKVKANANTRKNAGKKDFRKELDELDRIAKQTMEEAEKIDDEENDRFGDDDGNPLPPELRQREGRRKRIAECLKQIKDEEDHRETEFNKMVEERIRKETEQAVKGKKLRGRKPKFRKETKPISRNPSDPDSRLMISSNGFVQGYNAQAMVDCESQIIIAENVVQDCNDEQQLKPMLDEVRGNFGKVPIKLLADSGYFCTAVVKEIKDTDLYVATHSSYDVRQGVPLGKKKRKPTVRDYMAAKLKTERGHAIFSQRGRTVECVFGQTKENRGFRRFHLRGLNKVRGEWTLQCIGHNLHKLWLRTIHSLNISFIKRPSQT